LENFDKKGLKNKKIGKRPARPVLLILPTCHRHVHRASVAPTFTATQSWTEQRGVFRSGVWRLESGDGSQASKGAVAELAPPPAMASSSKASDSSSQRSKVQPRFTGRSPQPDWFRFSSASCFPVFCALQRSDHGTGREAAPASVVPIHGNLTQLIRQIKSRRLLYIKVSDRARPDHVTEIPGE
jgi:hypothetical protein